MTLFHSIFTPNFLPSSNQQLSLHFDRIPPRRQSSPSPISPNSSVQQFSQNLGSGESTNTPSYLLSVSRHQRSFISLLPPLLPPYNLNHVCHTLTGGHSHAFSVKENHSSHKLWVAPLPTTPQGSPTFSRPRYDLIFSPHNYRGNAHTHTSFDRFLEKATSTQVSPRRNYVPNLPQDLIC